MKRVWIYGYAGIGRDVLKLIMEDCQYECVGIIDEKVKETDTGIDISTIDACCNKILSDDLIIVCCMTEAIYQEITETLEKKGKTNFIYYTETEIYKTFQRKYPIITTDEGHEERFVSKPCTEWDFRTEWFHRYENELQIKTCRHHRKYWEFCYIVHVLEHNRMLSAGKKGLGFAVGREPLPCYFASRGVEILATDLDSREESAKEWIKTGQNASGDIDKLYRKDMLDQETFHQKVKYRNVDMNDIPEDIGCFDFCWSSCAIEHIGGLDKSKDFLKKMIGVLRDGGIAVHTTEFNLSSDEATIEEGYNVLFRRKDIAEMRDWFLAHGCIMEASFLRGRDKEDLYIDMMSGKGWSHLTLENQGFACTSYAIVVKKSYINSGNSLPEQE